VAEFQVTAGPVEKVSLELTGSQDVKFDGALLKSCLEEMIRCASISGCLSSGEVHLTDRCVETLTRHNQTSDCVAHGFGLGVRPFAKSKEKS
jgi:hypothetical protein